MVETQKIGNQLGDYLDEREQREANIHNASLELQDLLLTEFGLVAKSGDEEQPFDWGWLRQWARFFSPKDAFKWIKAGIFDPEDADQMKTDGQFPSDGDDLFEEKSDEFKQRFRWEIAQIKRDRRQLKYHVEYGSHLDTQGVLLRAAGNYAHLLMQQVLFEQKAELEVESEG